MKRIFVNCDEVILLLKQGWEIFTSRGSGPSKPLFFKLYSQDPDVGSKRIHHKTIEKLIRDGMIIGTNDKHRKYKLRGLK